MLTYWITEYQKSCDHPYWSHRKPSMHGNLRADTVFQKSGFHLVAHYHWPQSPISHAGNDRTQLLQGTEPCSFSHCQKVSVSQVWTNTVYLSFLFFGYKCCFMDEKVSVSAITVPVRKMTLSSIHCWNRHALCMALFRMRKVCASESRPFTALSGTFHSVARGLWYLHDRYSSLLHRTEPTVCVQCPCDYQE